jgi:transposase
MPGKLSRKSELAAAFRYMRAGRTAPTRCFEDGRLSLDNNPAERALRGVAIGRKPISLLGRMPVAGVPTAMY